MTITIFHIFLLLYIGLSLPWFINSFLVLRATNKTYKDVGLKTPKASLLALLGVFIVELIVAPILGIGSWLGSFESFKEIYYKDTLVHNMKIMKNEPNKEKVLDLTNFLVMFPYNLFGPTYSTQKLADLMKVLPQDDIKWFKSLLLELDKNKKNAK